MSSKKGSFSRVHKPGYSNDKTKTDIKKTLNKFEANVATSLKEHKILTNTRKEELISNSAQISSKIDKITFQETIVKENIAASKNTYSSFKVQFNDILNSALNEENYLSVCKNLEKLFESTKYDQQSNNIPTNNLKENMSNNYTEKYLTLEAAKESIESDLNTNDSTNDTNVNAIETNSMKPKACSEENEFKQIQDDTVANSKNDDEEDCKITRLIMDSTEKRVETNVPKKIGPEIRTTQVYDLTEMYPSSSKINNPVLATKKLLHNSQLAEEHIDNKDVIIINDDDDADSKFVDGFFVKDYNCLIEFIKDCRSIWDHTMNLTDCTDSIKERCWNRIFVFFAGKYSMGVLKKTWSYLKQEYTRQKKERSSSSDEKKQIEPIYFEQLTFLDSILDLKKRTPRSLHSSTSDSEIDYQNPAPKRTKIPETSTKKRKHSGDHYEITRKKGSICSVCQTLILKNSNSEHSCTDSKPNLTEIPSSSKINNPVLADKKLLYNSQLAEEHIDNKDVIIINDDDDADSKFVDGFFVKDYNCLIELIKDCRPIWDHKMKLTDHTDSKEDSWNKIFVKFEGKYSMDVLKKTWSYLKQKYMREKKKKLSGSGKKEIKWIYFKQLTFLDSILDHKKRTSRSLYSSTSDSETDYQDPAPKRTKSTDENVNIARELLKELKESRNAPPIPLVVSKNNEDELDIFMSYLKSRMTDLPNDIIVKLQHKCLDLVKKEYNNLNRHA